MEAQLLAGGMAEVAPDPPGFVWVSEIVKLVCMAYPWHS